MADKRAEKRPDKPSKAVRDSSIEQKPTSPVLTTDEAARKIENSDRSDSTAPNRNQG